VRSDGLATKIVCRRGENTVEEVLKVEKQLRKKLQIRKPLLMQRKDWINFKAETHCHICEKALVQNPFWTQYRFMTEIGGSYCAQAHKRFCFKDKFIGPKIKLQPLNEINKWIKNSQEDCIAENPWL